MKNTLVAIATLLMVVIMATSFPVLANETQEVATDTTIIGHFMMVVVKEDGYAVSITVLPNDTGTSWIASILDGTIDGEIVLSNVTSICETEKGVTIEWGSMGDYSPTSPMTIIGRHLREVLPY